VSVDDLRQQLRERGYLSHGIERWFALDPWSSRTFWLELIIVAMKATVVIGAFALLPLVAVMLFRNFPLTPLEVLMLAVVYGAAAFGYALILLIAVALILKSRPAILIDTPRALLAISFAVSAALASPMAVWWYRFDAPPRTAELLVGLALIITFFLMATVAVSAALLSFSIYELQRVPAIHQRSRAAPMTTAAAILTALLFLPAYAGQEKRTPGPPIQVVTTPTSRRVALIAVDGLTFDIARARPDLTRNFVTVASLRPMSASSTAERWASIGTGVPPPVHGVHAVEGVRLRGGRHLIQTISTADVALRRLAVAARLARREPLPPTIRRRDYLWEIFGQRGVPSVAVNWWTSDDAHIGALDSVGQASIFTADPLAVDDRAAKRFLTLVDQSRPQFATVYLPALDVILNRRSRDRSIQLADSVRALDHLTSLVGAIRARRFDVLLLGIPGEGQSGVPVLSSTFVIDAARASPLDIAPTLAALLGFPASEEMVGKPLAPSTQARIPSYGPRVANTENLKVNEEYYESLKSLGYIR
jgi:hypothetical protein